MIVGCKDFGKLITGENRHQKKSQSEHVKREAKTSTKERQYSYRRLRVLRDDDNGTKLRAAAGVV